MATARLLDAVSKQGIYSVFEALNHGSKCTNYTHP